ncbi:Uncharacterised protein [uncultured archaeon]|nr:Uncharacterised protein [uncultured archaeon]
MVRASARRASPSSMGGFARFRQNLMGTASKARKAAEANLKLARMRGMTPEQLEEMQYQEAMKERNEQVRAWEFEHVNARKTHEAESRKELIEATEKIHSIISLELNSSFGKILSAEIAKALGHEVIGQISAEQLKHLLVQSPRLKSIIMRLKGGARMIDKRELAEAMEEVKGILQQAMQ